MSSEGSDVAGGKEDMPHFEGHGGGGEQDGRGGRAVHVVASMGKADPHTVKTSIPKAMVAIHVRWLRRCVAAS